MEIALSSRKDRDIDIRSDRKLSASEYLNNVLSLSEDLGKFQSILDRLNRSVSMSGMRFASSKLKMLFH